METPDGAVYREPWRLMSPDGNYIVSALNDNVRTFNRTGDVIWNRITGSPFRAVAVSSDGSLVIAADDRGYVRSWTC